MTPERWQQVKGLLASVLAQPDGERRDFLEKECRDDPSLRQEVETLLEFEDGPHDFTPVFSIHQEDANLGRHIGPYKVLELLGRGGMGAVYLAVREDDYRQRVALKLIKRGMDSDEIIRRFRNERQILARLEHPSIARILDGGTTDDGLPYFALEYVEGQPIDRYCVDQGLTVRQRLGLFREVCQAVQLSHQNLVVHRDLKPGNILVTAEGVPKLLDFGIAKLLQPGLASPAQETAPSQRPMTLKYASPEQVRGEPVTTASDVYSLGVLLFELLTGHTPHGVEPPVEAQVVWALAQREPRRPSTAVDPADNKLRRRLEGDVDSIVLQALAKEPQERYGSAEQLSADLGRHLTGLPVTARQSTFGYRASKFLRRNWVAVAVLFLIIVFSVSTTVLWNRAARERDQALLQQQRAKEVSEFLEELFKSTDPDTSQGQEVSAHDLLERGRKKITEALEGDPVLLAYLQNTLGTAYGNLGLYEEAAGLLKEALEGLRQYHPKDHPELARTLNNLARMYRNSGEEEKAESLLREALAIHHRLELAPAPSGTVKFMNNLATILMDRGEYAEAEDLFQQGLAIRVELYGAESLNTASSLYNLGILAQQTGDLKLARERLEKSLKIRKRHYTNPHTRVATVLVSLARVLHEQGSLKEAERCYREALEIRAFLFEDNHPHVAIAKRDLAGLLMAQGNLHEACGLLLAARATLLHIGSLKGSEIATIESLLGACQEGPPPSAEGLPQPLIKTVL